MSSPDNVARAVEDLRRAHRHGRLAHAYLLVGNPKGDAADVVVALLQTLFCPHGDPPCGDCINCKKVRERIHEDVAWIEPASKSRRITIDEMRSLNHRMATTSFDGGWKAGILLDAERMTEPAANAFLKTLEEPPPRSILFMLTSSPQHLMETIVSRCQRVMISGGQTLEGGEWEEPLMDILRDDIPRTVLGAYGKASRLDSLLKALKKSITEAAENEEDREYLEDKVLDARISGRVREAQAGMLRMMLGWHRDLLLLAYGADPGHLQFPAEADTLRRQAEALNPPAALQQVQAMEDAIRQLDRHMPARAVFEAAMIDQARALTRAGKQG